MDHSGGFGKDFGTLIVILGAIAVLLFAIFSFLASAQTTLVTGLMLFIVVSALLIAGYAVGIVVLAVVGVYVLARFWQSASKPPTKEIA